MKHFKIIFLFLLVTSFGKVDEPNIYTESWKLKKIDYPNKPSINNFEIVWFLTSDGKKGGFNINDNELFIEGTWTKNGNHLIIKENKEFFKYEIISWTNQQIILTDDKANYYFSK